MKNRIGVPLLAFLLVLVTAGAGFGQTETARLEGTVTDPSGAPVPGATISVTRVETGRNISGSTNDSGYYVVPALPAGHYHVDVTKDGFDKVQRDFELTVSQIAVVDFQLTVGAVTQTVSVEAGSPV